MLNRSVRINFRYQLGKMDFRMRRKTKSVRNDDVMGGGDSGMNGGSTQGSSGQQRSSRSSSSSSGKKKPIKKVKPTDAKIDINGKWKGSVETPRGTMEQTFTFKVEGTTLTGSVETMMGSTELKNGKITGNTFTFDVSFGPYTITQTGTILGQDKILLQNERGEMNISRIK